MKREDAEYNAIGVLLNEDPAIIDISEKFYAKVTPDCFRIKTNSLIYDAMRNLHSKGKPANIIEIAELINSFKVFNKDFDGIVKVLENTRNNAEYYKDSLEMFCNVILDGYVKDSIISSLGITEPSMELLERLEDIEADALVKNLEKITDRYNQSKNSIDDNNTNLSDYMRDREKGGLVADLNELINTKEISTGFKDLDSGLTGSGDSKGGLIPERLYLLGAVPSLGKTTLVHQIADNIAAQGTPVLFFSLEQSKRELILKSIVRENYKKNRVKKDRKHGEILCSTGYLMKHGFKDECIKAAARSYLNEKAAFMNVYEGNFSTTVETIAATVKRFKRMNREKTPVVIIDYLQILKPADQNGKAANKTKDIVDMIVNSLKIMARSEQVPVIAISSINRQSYKEYANFSALKESGSLEYSADTVLILQLKALADMNKPPKDGEKPAKLDDSQKERILHKAKTAEIRNLQLVCLKNRGGKVFEPIDLFYKPQYEYFTTDEKELNQ